MTFGTEETSPMSSSTVYPGAPAPPNEDMGERSFEEAEEDTAPVVRDVRVDDSDTYARQIATARLQFTLAHRPENTATMLRYANIPERRSGEHGWNVSNSVC